MSYLDLRIGGYPMNFQSSLGTGFRHCKGLGARAFYGELAKLGRSTRYWLHLLVV
jgi:hypothetical protein